MSTINAIDSAIPIAISKGGTNATSMSTTDGVAYYNGTSILVTSAGTANQVLTSNGAGVAPTYAAITNASGTPIQQSRTTSFSTTSTTTVLQTSGTPTTSNTVLLTSLTITPTTSTNILIFNWTCVCATSITLGTSYAGVAFFLFQGTTLLTSESVFCGVGGNVNTINFQYQLAAGTTSSTTYSIYYACNSSTGSGTAYINQNSSGNNYNGTYAYTLTVTEVAL